MAIADFEPRLRELKPVPVEVTDDYQGPLFPQKYPPLRNFFGQHIVSAEQFDKESFEILYDRASEMDYLIQNDRIGALNHLKGYQLATLFYQLSTRTRLTMEAAMKRLGGEVLTETQATSAQQKGEPLEHTLRVISGELGRRGIADVIGLRHPESGVVINDRIMRYANVPVINGGDGNREHVFQACKDVFFMAQEAGGIDKLAGKEVTFYGDQKFSRVSHSTLYSLARLGVNLNLVAPSSDLKAPDDLIDVLLSQPKSKVREYESLEEIPDGPGDYLYVMRLQLNLIRDEKIRNNPDNKYVLNRSFVDRNPKTKILSAMPIDGEIHKSIDHHPQAAYFRQSDAGLPVAGALFSLTLKGN